QRPLREPDWSVPESGVRTDAAARVEIADPRCLRYSARVVRGVRVGDSPEWLRRRLEAIGQRPINNVVDATNYVLWEMGQPLHAFDLAKLAGARIVVRGARAGEELRTLDGIERRLEEGMLVIADTERAVALAGVMGGRDSEVTAATRDLLIESAHFRRRAVRQVARGLGLKTDASHRFERGADPEACARAAARAARIIAEISGGEVLSGALDERSPWPADWPPRGRLQHARLERFGGVAIPAASVERILGGLGFSTEREDGGWRITVPSWRFYDVPARPRELGGLVEEQDLFEEVLRHHGLDDLPAALPALAGRDEGRSPAHELRQRVRDYLAAAGFAEAIHYAFQSAAADRAFPALAAAGEPARIANPLSSEYQVLRRSLLPNLVEGARLNQRRGARAVRLFEVGSLFPGGEAEEVEAVAAVAGGHLGAPWEREVEIDLFDLKGAVEGLAAERGATLEFRPASRAGFLPGTSADILAAGEPVGVLGQVADTAEPYGLCAAELRLSALRSGRASRRVTLPSRFPGVAADLTLTHALSTAWAEIESAIHAAAPPELQDHGLKVRYLGPGVPQGAVNTTIWFQYGSADRSLTQDEVNARHQALAAELVRRFGWSDRSQGGS
ncbi:MAG TPA: phenylalanine--tRNA ligase subunit beta, partial [Thermoanaerobaculia bacterium]|nr:phenylalanine--tRNA ligase subunit beta [Thermoanaerobaculia bacterium]